MTDANLKTMQEALLRASELAGCLVAIDLEDRELTAKNFEVLEIVRQANMRIIEGLSIIVARSRQFKEANDKIGGQHEK